MIRTLLMLLALSTTNAQASDSLNILLYHHIANDTPFSTTTKIDDFKAHLDYLEQHDYQVVDLVEAVKALRLGEHIADKAVAIVFDDSYESIYLNAFPMLQQRNMPFSIFVSTDAVDNKYRSMTSWAQLKEMKAAGAHILNHSRDHAYMVHDQSEGWLDRAIDNINYAQQRIEEELGETPRHFAYPYGEFNDELKQAVADLGYFAYGQHSGGVAMHSDFQALPRFPAAGFYANLKTLKTKLASKPLPVIDFRVKNPVIQGDQNPPKVSFTVDSQDFYKKFLQCYINGDTVKPQWNDNQAMVVATNALPPGRNRYNCTVPAKSGGYYWFSQPWLVPKADGSFPKQ